MIVFFLPDLGRARRLAKALYLDYEDVDGPFRIFEGDIGAADLCLYVAPGNSDSAYAAARIASRRGARVFIPITEGTVLDSLAENEDIAPGILAPVARIYDLEGLKEPLRILPDSCREFPFNLDEFLPSKALWKTDIEGVVLGTMHQKIRNLYLARALFKKKNIGCFDRQMAGYASAAVEDEIELRPVVFIDSVLARDGLHAEIPLGLDKDFDKAVLEIGKAAKS